MRRSKKSLEEEKDFGERRREQSIRMRESEIFRKNECLVTRIVEIGIIN